MGGRDVRGEAIPRVHPSGFRPRCRLGHVGNAPEEGVHHSCHGISNTGQRGGEGKRKGRSGRLLHNCEPLGYHSDGRGCEGPVDVAAEGGLGEIANDFPHQLAIAEELEGW